MIFEKTISSQKRALTNARNVNHREKTARYSLYKFSFTFQVWAYEMISPLTNRVATRVSETVILRLCHWVYTNTPTYETLKREFLSHDRLVATDEERFHWDRVMSPPEARSLSPDPINVLSPAVHPCEDEARDAEDRQDEAFQEEAQH